MDDVTAWVLGDQLHPRVVDGDADRVLMVEAAEFADRHPYHRAKLTLLFSAMRHFRDRLRERGNEVRYERADSFRDGVAAFLADHPETTLRVREPASHGAGRGLRRLVADCGGDIEVVENDLFLVSPAEFDEWTDGPPYRHEAFYRWVRRRTGYLMAEGEPVGGQFNFDERNRETPPAGYEPPAPPKFEPDSTTRAVHEWVGEAFETWGTDDIAAVRWPVTRAEAERALDRFVAERLDAFGPYQDAMLRDEWALHHSLLSAAINLGLLAPDEVVERVLEAWETRDIPVASVEGFLRQVVGWREFMRHVYRREMPELADANQLGADRDLPPAYWEPAATEMACLGDAAGGVYERGYAHHIERLMVLSNFALLYGASPQGLNEWFHAGFVDAYHWVTTPNVLGMGAFATDAFTTKPYAASANYIDRMSDHCEGCPYDPDRTTGEGACPFNALYWAFLDEHAERFRENHRMGLVYSHLDDKDLPAIRERAREVRDRAADGDL